MIFLIFTLSFFFSSLWAEDIEKLQVPLASGKTLNIEMRSSSKTTVIIRKRLPDGSVEEVVYMPTQAELKLSDTK